MRYALLVLIFIIPSKSALSQSGLEKAAWVGGSVVVLATYDYFGYNLTSHNSDLLTGYRVSFVILQAALTYILYEKFGLSSAIGLNLIWWTFGIDMLYYGICELNSHRTGSWASRGAWAEDSRRGISHAGWTPVGLLRQDHRLPANTIVAQSIAGAVIGLGITISF